jgi:hypothetical protein
MGKSKTRSFSHALDIRKSEKGGKKSRRKSCTKTVDKGDFPSISTHKTEMMSEEESLLYQNTRLQKYVHKQVNKIPVLNTLSSSI